MPPALKHKAKEARGTWTGYLPQSGRILAITALSLMFTASFGAFAQDFNEPPATFDERFFPAAQTSTQPSFDTQDARKKQNLPTTTRTVHVKPRGNAYGPREPRAHGDASYRHEPRAIAGRRHAARTEVLQGERLGSAQLCRILFSPFQRGASGMTFASIRLPSATARRCTAYASSAERFSSAQLCL